MTEYFALTGMSMQEVYIAEATNGLFKIGVSSDAKARVKGLNSQSPIDIKLLATYSFGEKSQYMEHRLQRRFASKRVKGEWYRLNQNELQQLWEICRAEVKNGN